MLRLVIIGAHPDDADYYAGGLAALYRQHGHAVRMVSLTNGAAGHQTLCGPELAKRRRAEAAAAGAIIGAEYLVLDNPDGELLPTLENRQQVIKLIREFRPDLVLTHRPSDYHPDHRYTSQLVQDAAYMVTVPAIVPEVPHLSANPVIAYLPDDFQKPYPFRPDVVVDVTGVVDRIVAMLDCHVSQFYEWLPFNRGDLATVPTGVVERREWLAEQVRHRLSHARERHQDAVLRQLGSQRFPSVRFIEAFEMCEYGAPLDRGGREKLFGFLTASSLARQGPFTGLAAQR